jgi:hypothetical protein
VSAYQPPAGDGSRGEPPQNIATAIAEVSERATLLVREEIELALIFVLIGLAWLLYWALPVETFAYFWGFFAMAAILMVLGALAGLFAARAVKRGAPPTPSMAIEEARKIREAVSTSGASAAAYTNVTPTPTMSAPVEPVEPDVQAAPAEPDVRAEPVEPQAQVEPPEPDAQAAPAEPVS